MCEWLVKNLKYTVDFKYKSQAIYFVFVLLHQ